MKRLKSNLKYVAVVFGLAVIGLAAAWQLVPPPKVDDFQVSPTLLDSRGRLYHARLSADGEWLLPVPLSAMGRWLPLVAVEIEDRRFTGHKGVDLFALGRAMGQNIKNLKVVSGASTITAQVVRISDPKERRLANKFVEFIQAMKLEKDFSKDEILEIYLNRAPFGGNIRGVEAAARFYFDKPAKSLSLGESALLIALLRGPTFYRPDRHPERARERRDHIIRILRDRGAVTQEEAEDALAEPVAGRRGTMPDSAWHLADLIIAEAGPEPWRWNTPGTKYGFRTTLNLETQDFLEMRLRRQLESYPNRVTGAGAIMDNEGRLLAYVGNARRQQRGSGHWVDCALAPRSPGSALKPFIYLEAFAEKGLTPASLLSDTPLRLSGQAPRNFDEYYRGPVNAKNALAESLNVPAVRVLRLVGHEWMVEKLRLAGFTFLQKNGLHYGDSLALGGCEVNVWQMLGAYGTLGAQGREVKPRYRPRQADSSAPPRQLFPSGAVWLVNDSLQNPSRLAPAQRLDRHNSSFTAPAFKTGTSHGFRDTWLATYTPSHTVVLWMGDPSGRGHNNLVALKALGPAGMSLMNDLARSGPSMKWPERPDDLESYAACLISGQPAGPYCPGQRQSLRVRSSAKTHPCRLHLRIGGQVAVHWPQELEGFMNQRKALAAPSRPVIVSPPKNGTLVMTAGEDMRVPLRCEGAFGRVHWYVDDEFFAVEDSAGTPTLTLTPGRHRVSLVDENSATAKVEFSVKLEPAPSDGSEAAMLVFD